MSRHARERNPEVRHDPELPLFARVDGAATEDKAAAGGVSQRAERTSRLELRQDAPAIYSRFSSDESCLTAPLSANGESGDCLSGAQPPCSPRDVARARRTDRETSHAAARSVVNLGRTRDAILALLRRHGAMTDEQIAMEYCCIVNAIPVSPSGLRSRRADLVRMGFVEACGTGKTAAGRECQIWRLRK